MKVAWLAALMVVTGFAGCLESLGGDDEPDGVMPPDVGYDPSEVTVTGVETFELTIASGDVELDTIVYVPVTTDAPNDEPIRWPVVVLLHGWGFPKEMYTNMPQAGASPDSQLPANNLMQEFAEGGLLTVAYDARGWYQSTGTSTVAGAAEMMDLRNVIDYVNANYETSGLTGVAGVSYGGGQSLLAWSDFDDVVTAATHQPWVDLYEGLAPGNTPKAEWVAMLAAVTPAGTGTGMPQTLPRWLEALGPRQDADAVDDVRAEMNQRSILDDTDVDKPLLMCQGLQETLFPQSHNVWMTAPGFVRAHYFQGGHLTLDEACWDKTKQWMQFFLGGHDTGVAQWPAVTSVDHNGDSGLVDYSDDVITQVDNRQFWLHSEQMVQSASPNRTFTINQQLVSNPAQEPQVVWEATGQPFQSVPSGMRQDPSAVFFTSPPADQSETLLGAPSVHLMLSEDATPFQVVGTLFHESGGNWRMLGRGAATALAPQHLDGLNVTMDFPWMKANLASGDRIVLKLGGNDEGAWTPLLANYSVDFTGESTIELPFFAPTPYNG